MLNPDTGMKVSLAFARAAGINRFAMQGGAGLRKSRKAWNGGYIGYDEFVAYYRRALTILGAKAVSNPSSKPLKRPDALLQEYQRKLNEIARLTGDKAFSVGKADGWNGRKTKAAITASQKMSRSLWALAQKHNAVGKMGKKTRANIDRLLAKYSKTVASVAPAPRAQAQSRPLAPVKDYSDPVLTTPKPAPIKRGWWQRFTGK